MSRKEKIKSQLKRPIQKPTSVSSTAFSSTIKRVKPYQKRQLQKPTAIKSSPLRPGFAKAMTGKQGYAGQADHNSRFVNLDKLMRLFFVLGSLFFVIYFGLRINQEIQLSMVNPRVPSEQIQVAKKTSAAPNEIIINKISINLPVEKTFIKKGIWEISDKGASYLGISAKPGEKGAIIMYGHNTTDRFGSIRYLINGDKIELKTSDGKRHVYMVTKTMKVKPDRMDVFAQKEETLVIYTCDGFADLERFVILAKPSK